MHLPNYHDGSLVNLMSSLLHAFGAKSEYAPLPLLPPSELADTTNVVLLVLDGFGYEFLQRQEPNSLFHKHLKGKITSVFPSTTASCVTTFHTGLAPQQHAVTGWFMFLKEVGSIVTTLLFRPRCCPASLRGEKGAVRPDMLYGTNDIARQINRKSCSVYHEKIVKAEYNKAINSYPKHLPFVTFLGCLEQIRRKIVSDRGKKYIFAYWDSIDSLSHHYGTTSREVIYHYYELEEQLKALIRELQGTDTTLIITADHGLIDTEASTTIRVEQHPELRETLTMPLCGEARAPFCYVRPSKAAQFERYVQQHFSGICDLYSYEELIHKSWFGLFEPDLRLFDRIGDYVMVMRENYVLDDSLLGEECKNYIGRHGGLSKEEMFVPLIVIHT
ncbi:hypothetical protein CSA56_11555 [candidate division KSB3 bacterium]|uniref:Phosphodiesterase n=1 Tax=candidate division KSB3 bacterium TaxID=2044937 RepID=A0A2G6KCL2_9BACT|nr:MAG: hypothetical protein CSA56_11555 [candidate division KSB3 bacterium]